MPHVLSERDGDFHSTLWTFSFISSHRLASQEIELNRHDGLGVCALQSHNSVQCEWTSKFIKGIICIWVPETFGASGFFLGFGIYRFSRGWKAEILLLHTTS